MENFKIRVTTEQESKEVQELFFELGYGWHGKGKLISYLDKILSDDFGWLVLWKPSYLTNTVIQMGSGFESCKEITIQYLRDLVVLKRNSIDDATHTDQDGWKWYIGDDSYVWQAGNAHQLKQWDQSSLAMVDLEPIEKLVDKEVKMKEYIANVSGDWRLVDSHELVSGRIEVPEGAEIFLLDKSFGEDTLYFVKHDGEVFHEYYTNATDVSNNAWIKGTIKELHNTMGKVLWQRKHTITPNTSIQNKLKPNNEDVKMKEFLNPEQGYTLVKCFVGETPIPESWIEVPEGAEFLTGLINERLSQVFWKPSAGEVYQDGRFKPYVFHGSISYEEYKSRWINNCVLWKRHENKEVTTESAIQDKLKFIEKWLTGEKIQYILGVESDKIQSEKTQWYNFTEGDMRYIKRHDIKFREAPKYVTINEVEFKNIESILNYIKSNFDLEDGEE